MELNNIKMWESILKELWHYPLNSWLVECIKAALADQGLKYNSDTKKIEYIKQEISKLEVGKLYKCTKDCYTAVGAKILSEGKLYHCTAENEVFSEFGGSTWVGDLLCYLCPATPEKIQQEQRQDPCIDCKMAANNCALCCSKFKEYHSQSGEEVLSEFEDKLGEIMIPTWDITKECEECKREVDDIKKFAKELMDLARKQIVSEFDGLQYQMVVSRFDNIPLNERFRFDSYFYQEGIRDTLKAIKGE